MLHADRLVHHCLLQHAADRDDTSAAPAEAATFTVALDERKVRTLCREAPFT